MRLLVIAAQADYRLLVRKHVEIEWPDANFVEHRLGEDGVFDAEFAATGFDAVIIVSVPPAEGTNALVADLLAKPEFAPIVVLLLQAQFFAYVLLLLWSVVLQVMGFSEIRIQLDRATVRLNRLLMREALVRRP